MDLLENSVKETKMESIKEMYKISGGLHGHFCPGLAIGVRAAMEALLLLDVQEAGKGVYCIAESKACYLDGIQVVFGTTWGNGMLELRDRGKTAFDFYNKQSGRSVRLCAVEWPEGMSKEETIEFILTAPLEKVFKTGEVHFALEEGNFEKAKKVKCPVCKEQCAETYMREKDGVLVCPDCFE